MVNEIDRPSALMGLTHTDKTPMGLGKPRLGRSHPGGDQGEWRELSCCPKGVPLPFTYFKRSQFPIFMLGWDFKSGTEQLCDFAKVP